ncbi:protein of unknown function [Magnetospira sp. QH-2]|nr:protein of unknown function [Magnetospira sp. QH-2]
MQRSSPWEASIAQCQTPPPRAPRGPLRRTIPCFPSAKRAQRPGTSSSPALARAVPGLRHDARFRRRLSSYGSDTSLRVGRCSMRSQPFILSPSKEPPRPCQRRPLPIPLAKSDATPTLGADPTDRQTRAFNKRQEAANLKAARADSDAAWKFHQDKKAAEQKAASQRIQARRQARPPNANRRPRPARPTRPACRPNRPRQSRPKQRRPRQPRPRQPRPNPASWPASWA